MTLVSKPAREGYDVIVVGSGPAGMTVAKKLDALTDLRVLIVESGGENVVASELARVQAEGDFHRSYFEMHSQRVFGGTSNIWRGYCAVLDERPFLADEWPFPYRELYGYYPEAARILGVPPVVHERPEVPLDGTFGSVVYRPWYFSAPVRFGEGLGENDGLGFANWLRDSTGVDILLDHTAMRLATRSGVVEGVSLRRSNADARSFQVAGDSVVLAAGSIQNARLLLLSLGGGGGGGRMPALGRYLTDHPHFADFAYVEIEKAAMERVMDRSGVRVSHGIALSSPFSSERSAHSATVQLVDPQPVRALLAARRKQAFGAIAMVKAEMAPLPSNNVQLSRTEVDLLGQPRARVAMTFDVAAVMNAVGPLNAELVRAGIGRLQFSSTEANFGPRAGPFVYGGGHLMGTTRMGKHPSRSVTDATGRVHGFSNLYVAGSSLFPASSAANPTLTIVALALRLAEHLAGRTQ